LKKEAFFKPPFFISYLISDPELYGSTPKALSSALQNSISKHHIDMICFRDKKTKDIESLASTFLNTSKRFDIPFVLINSNIKLAIKLKFDGVHLTSLQFDDIEFAKQNNLFVIISCHTEQEIELAYTKGADGVTYSPIFFKEDKGEPKGCENLLKIVKKCQKNNFFVIALGGIINNLQVRQVQSTGVKGFASIRYFL